MKFSGKVFILSLVMLFFSRFPVTTFADVTVERIIKTGGVVASETHEREHIKGLEKRTDSKMEFTGKVVGMFTKPKNFSTIYLVERDLIVEVNHTKKTYAERSISIADEDQGVESEGAKGREASGDPDREKEETEVKILRNEFDLKETGEEKEINGFSCKRYLLTWLIETENVKTKERNKSLMTGDFWNTQEEGKVTQLMKEEEAFSRAYLKKLGLDMTPGEMQKFGIKVLGGMLGATGVDLKKEMGKMKGYPIVTAVKWEAGGDKEEQVAEEEEEKVDVTKGVKGFLGGLLKKKAKDMEKEERAGKEGELQTVFESYSEIMSIDTSTLSKGKFEVPKEYKKEKSAF